METKHTPGPWNINGQDLPNMPETGGVSVFASGEVIATAYRKSDARLIAVAPEMLEAVKALLEFDLEGADDGWTYQRRAAIQKLKRVIAKAKGK